MTQTEKRSFAKTHISVDCVVLGFDGEKLNALLVKRSDIKLHDMKLPGSLVYADETPDQAAARVLEGYTGLKDLTLMQFHTFGSLERTSNPEDVDWIKRSEDEDVERIVTVAYFAIVRIARKLKHISKENESLAWVPVNSLPRLAFDHNVIVSVAVEHFAKLACSNNKYFFELLPKKFTIYQFRKLYELAHMTMVDPGNFHKKVTQMPYVVPLEEKEVGKKHRSARYYKYNKKIFKKDRLQ